MGPFISLLSETYGLPEKSVAVVARVMREAGWLTTGARGVNAPEMTAVDAARLTLALLSGETPGKVVEEFERLRHIVATMPPPDHGFMAGSGLDRPHSIEDALIWIFGLTSAARETWEHGQHAKGHWHWSSIYVTLEASTRSGYIFFPGNSCTYEEYERLLAIEAAWKGPPNFEDGIDRRNDAWNRLNERKPGMRVVRTIESSELFTIADAIAPPASTTVTGDQEPKDA